MKIKSMTIEQMDDSGKGLARIAVLSAIDSDGDTYAPGAFSWKEGGGQWVSIIPAHDRRAMPFGKAWVYEKGDDVLADLYLNLDTQAGKDWHAALKFDLATGKAVQEWSYGYETLDQEPGLRNGVRVNVLKRQDVDEISPVLRGAGIGTGTLAMKGLKGATLKDDHFKALIGGLDELATALGDDVAAVSVTGLKQLEDIHQALGKALGASAAAAAPGDQGEAARLHAAYIKGLVGHHLPK